MAEVKVEIRQVAGKGDMRKFINFPYVQYKGNKYWCPPPRFDEWNTLNPKKNPAFDYCDAAFWLAFRDGKVTGRIAGIINPHANESWKEDLVRFGWIDFIDDFDVYSALIRTVEEWGRSKGMKGIHGPLGFTDMDPEGMLVEGFDQVSALSAIYNYPYYAEFIERDGFTKAVDWVQFSIPVPENIPDKVIRTAELVEQKYNLHYFSSKKRKDILPYAKKMFVMQNEAFKELYGFSALSEKQMDLYTSQYFGFIRLEFLSLVLDQNDDIVAFGITIPHLGKALQKTNGRLFPFGFIHLLRAMKKNDAIHMYLVGVRPDYHGKGVLAMIFRQLHEEYLKNGIKIATTHPQLEENMKALTIWKNYEGGINIRRRCWRKPFDSLRDL